MILVRAIDSFLYKGMNVMTGNKVMVYKIDIPKLVAAKKISPKYLEIPEKPKKIAGRKRKKY